MEKLIISLVLSGVGAAILTLCSLKMLQIYQLSSYRTDGYFKWFLRSKGDYIFRYFSLAFFQFISLLIFNFSFPDSYLKYLGLILYIGLGVYFVMLQKKQKQKTPLKFTPRIVRQLVVLPIVYFGLCFLAVFFTFDYGIGYTPLAAAAFFIPICVTLAHFLACPVEALINRYYFVKAQRKLRGEIIKIGITGSYGKTTAKNILNAFLSKKYKVVSTPGSYNTPMGICKLVNSGGLLIGEAAAEVFIAEMGARRKGDIKKLCELVEPNHGIITAAGPQHLETFKTVDTVIKTKLELAAGASGFVVTNSGDKRLCEAAEKLRGELGKTKKDGGKEGFLYAGEAGADARCENIKVGAQGTTFTLTANGESVEISTSLLGRHIPQLVTSCALLSLKLGVSLNEIKDAAKELESVPHRLQLIKTGQNTVIDDAYNSNPEGAKNALEVLSCFEGFKVVITPGFVELGAAETDENIKLGANIAKTADILISVANQEIFKGAMESGMDKDRCYIEKSLEAAMERLALLKLEKLTILFLNDLPDNY